MFDKLLENYEVGERWESKGRTITEADIINFASLSGDWYPLHTDKEYAANTFFKQRIAHGLLILSAASGLLNFKPDIVVAFYGMDEARFPNPTFIGDTIHVELEVTAIEKKKNGTGVLIVRQEVKKQTGEIVAKSDVKLVVNQ